MAAGSVSALVPGSVPSALCPPAAVWLVGCPAAPTGRRQQDELVEVDGPESRISPRSSVRLLDALLAAHQSLSAEIGLHLSAGETRNGMS